MNPLQNKLTSGPSTASPLLTLTKASPLAAQARAQKLRVHAQGTRLDSAREEFRDRLTRHASERGDRPERADEAAAADAKGGPTSAKSDRQNTQAPDSQSDASLDRSDDAGPARPGDAAEAPEVERVVAEVLQGVDPALRLRPSEVARKAGTVAGHTARAKGEAPDDQPRHEPSQASSRKEEPRAIAAGDRKDVRPERSAAGETAAAAPTADVRGERRAAPQRADEATKPGPRTDAAAAAVERAGPIALPAGFTKVESQPAAHVDAQTGVYGPGGVRADRAGRAQESPPARSSIAEQVQHGLEVAMREVPAPAGERIVTMRLHPSALGSLRIAMQVRGDAVSLRFQVGSAKAKAAIEEAVEELKGSITRQGLRISSLEIEEESALAAPGDAAHAFGEAGAAGKGFATQRGASPGPEAPGSTVEAGRTPELPDADHEGGVLQVLTFRLDAVG